MIGDGKLREK